jgi:hypothetical protein
VPMPWKYSTTPVKVCMDPRLSDGGGLGVWLIGKLGSR